MNNWGQIKKSLLQLLYLKFCCSVHEKSPVQTDATLLANNSCHCWMLHVTFVCTSCCILLEDIAHLILNRSNFWSQQLPFVAEASRNNVESLCTALPTLLRPRTRITHALQSLMGCILPTMHYRSEYCWSCCIRLHTAATTNVTTRTIVGPTMMGVIPSVCTSARAFFSLPARGGGLGGDSKGSQPKAFLVWIGLTCTPNLQPAPATFNLRSLESTQEARVASYASNNATLKADLDGRRFLLTTFVSD